MSIFDVSVSGIRSALDRHSVSANNIANLNTRGFKSSRVNQSSVQTGGSQVSSTTKNFEQGPLVSTGRSNDLAIEGDGFFVQEEGNGRSFTRSGSFSINGEGNLVNQINGKKIMGKDGSPIEISQSDNQGNSLVSFDIGENGRVTGTFEGGNKKEFGQVSVAHFSNPSGLQKVGGSAFQPTSNSGDVQIGEPGTGGRGTIQSGFLEASNTDLITEILEQKLSQNSLSMNLSVVETKDEMMGEILDLSR